MSARTPTGIELISNERQRQIEVEGWDSRHDDESHQGTLTAAAICYASVAGSGGDIRGMIRRQSADGVKPRGWPWTLAWWKPGIDDSNGSRVRELVKAGALIAAEIDRLYRIEDARQ